MAEKNREIGELRKSNETLEQLIRDQADQVETLKNEMQEDIEAKLARLEDSLQDVAKRQLTFSVESQQQSQDATKGGQQSARQVNLLQSHLETMKTITLPNAIKHLEQKIEDQRIVAKGVVEKKLKQHQKEAKKQAEQGAAEQAKRFESADA